jgi:hypothetical protein
MAMFSGNDAVLPSLNRVDTQRDNLTPSKRNRINQTAKLEGEARGELDAARRTRADRGGIADRRNLAE